MTDCLRFASMSWVAFACLCAAPGVGRAEQRDPAAADALFREGRAAMKAEDYATACPKFAESHRLDPAGGTLLNLAECEEKRGKIASAQQHYREATEMLPADDPRGVHCKSKVKELEPRVPRLVIKLADGVPDGARVVRDGIELGKASLASKLPVDPGEHRIVLKGPGACTSELTVALEAGDSKAVEIGCGNGASAAETGAAPGPAGGTLRTAGYVVGGLGVVGVLVGAGFSLKAKSRDDDARAVGCDDQTCPTQEGLDLTSQSRSAGTSAIISYVVGGAALVGGGAMILFGGPKPAASSSRPRIAPLLGSGTLGVSAVGIW